MYVIVKHVQETGGFYDTGMVVESLTGAQMMARALTYRASAKRLARMRGELVPNNPQNLYTYIYSFRKL